MHSDLHRLTATEEVQLTRSDKLTVEDYARALLARVQERDSIVQGWVFLDPEQVLLQAKALDKIPADQRGPLHGVAFGVKDLILTKDMPTRYNSKV